MKVTYNGHTFRAGETKYIAGMIYEVPEALVKQLPNMFIPITEIEPSKGDDKNGSSKLK